MAVVLSLDREDTGKSGHTTTTEAIVQGKVVQQAEPKHHEQRQEDKAQPGALVTS